MAYSPSERITTNVGQSEFGKAAAAGIMNGVVRMIPKIATIKPQENYILLIQFDDGKKVLYDVKEDINDIPGYSVLRDIDGLFKQVQLDPSRTCVFWNDDVDLASDSLYEYGKPI